MFVLVEKESQNVWFVDAEKTRMIVCRREADAVKAAEKISEIRKVQLSYTKLDKKQSSGFWLLEDEAGTRHDIEPGIRVAFRTKKSAWNYAGSVFHKQSLNLIPRPA
jgi:hypothetical protein